MPQNRLFFIAALDANGENIDLLVIAADKPQAERFWREYYELSETFTPALVGVVPGVVPTEEAGAIDWEAVRMD